MTDAQNLHRQMTPEDVIANLRDLLRDPVTGDSLYDDAQVEFYASDARETIAAIRAQAARIAELERDAARYRWLRDYRINYGDFSLDNMCWAQMDWCVEVASLAPPSLDAAIDAAMQASPAPPQPSAERG